MRCTDVYIFSPITYEKPLKDVYGENLTWEFWGPRDGEMVSRCDELWVLCLENWENSRGVNYEINEAKKLGKPVHYLHVEIRDDKGEIAVITMDGGFGVVCGYAKALCQD
jgi:hypothetical protein